MSNYRWLNRNNHKTTILSGRGDILPRQVQERLEKELKSIVENDYATLYMIAQKLVKKSNEDGFIVENRGTAGTSLVAYCLGITEVDHIKYSIQFETFSDFNGDRKPNIVLTVTKEYKTQLEEYIGEILANSNEKLDNHEIEILEDDTTTILHKLQEVTGINPNTSNLDEKDIMKIMCSADTLNIVYFNSKLVGNFSIPCHYICNINQKNILKKCDY